MDDGIPEERTHTRGGAWRRPVMLAIGMRIGLGILAFFAYILIPQAPDRSFPSPGRELTDGAVLYDRMLAIWANWDGGWYLRIAEHGYQANPDSQAFFPLYPLLIGTVGRLFSGNYLLAGLLISSMMAVAAFVLLYELARRDFDQPFAKRAVLYLSIFPTSFYLFAVYTESLFLALLLGSFFAARHLRRWWLAGLLGALATLTRNVGILIVVPLALEWALDRYRRVSRESGEDSKRFDPAVLRRMPEASLAALALPVLGLGAWLLYNQITFGNAFASFRSHSAWSRHFQYPWETVVQSLRVLLAPGPAGVPFFKIDWYQGANLLDLSFFILGMCIFFYGCRQAARRQFPLSYLLFLGMGLVSPLLAPVQFTPLLSFPRFLLPLFPIFMLWGSACQRHPWLHDLTLYLWLPLAGLLFTLFVNGYWVA